jgi:hypothetical protein
MATDADRDFVKDASISVNSEGDGRNWSQENARPSRGATGISRWAHWSGFKQLEQASSQVAFEAPPDLAGTLALEGAAVCIGSTRSTIGTIGQPLSELDNRQLASGPPRGRTVMNHAPRNGQASDQANGNNGPRASSDGQPNPGQGIRTSVRSQCHLGSCPPPPALTFLQCHLSPGRARRRRSPAVKAVPNFVHH